MKEKDPFTQGYLCAVAGLIRYDGLVSTIAAELFRGGAGNMNLRELQEIGVDESDLDLFEIHWPHLCK